MAREEDVKTQSVARAGQRSLANDSFSTRLCGPRVLWGSEKLKNDRRESSEKRTSRRRRAENGPNRTPRPPFAKGIVARPSDMISPDACELWSVSAAW